MKKAITKPVITAAFLAAVVGVSSAPLSVGAEDGHHWNNNSWSRNDWRHNDHNRWGNNHNNNQHHRISDWEARNIAQRHFPGRWIVSDNQWWDHDGRLERQYRFNDNHVIVIRDDGVIIIILQR